MKAFLRLLKEVVTSLPMDPPKLLHDCLSVKVKVLSFYCSKVNNLGYLERRMDQVVNRLVRENERMVEEAVEGMLGVVREVGQTALVVLGEARGMEFLVERVRRLANPK